MSVNRLMKKYGKLSYYGYPNQQEATSAASLRADVDVLGSVMMNDHKVIKKVVKNLDSRTSDNTFMCIVNLILSAVLYSKLNKMASDSSADEKKYERPYSSFANKSEE